MKKKFIDQSQDLVPEGSIRFKFLTPEGSHFSLIFLLSDASITIYRKISENIEIPYGMEFNILYESQSIRKRVKISDLKIPAETLLEIEIFEEVLDEKPVIYIYPTSEMDVKIKFDRSVTFTAVYPPFSSDNGWEFHAKPDGTLLIGNRAYSSLFWESVSGFLSDFSEGFVVSGSDATDFLEEKLSILGLSEFEANEFIAYWLPALIKNQLSLVAFQFENYDERYPLIIEPKPDSVLRVFLAIKKIQSPPTVLIPEQILPHFNRSGYTVVEWGGRSE